MHFVPEAEFSKDVAQIWNDSWSLPFIRADWHEDLTVLMCGSSRLTLVVLLGLRSSPIRTQELLNSRYKQLNWGEMKYWTGHIFTSCIPVAPNQTAPCHQDLWVPGVQIVLQKNRKPKSMMQICNKLLYGQTSQFRIMCLSVLRLSPSKTNSSISLLLQGVINFTSFENRIYFLVSQQMRPWWISFPSHDSVSSSAKCRLHSPCLRELWWGSM